MEHVVTESREDREGEGEGEGDGEAPLGGLVGERKRSSYIIRTT